MDKTLYNILPLGTPEAGTQMSHQAEPKPSNTAPSIANSGNGQYRLAFQRNQLPINVIRSADHNAWTMPRLSLDTEQSAGERGHLHRHGVPVNGHGLSGQSVHHLQRTP